MTVFGVFVIIEGWNVGWPFMRDGAAERLTRHLGGLVSFMVHLTVFLVCGGRV